MHALTPNRERWMLVFALGVCLWGAASHKALAATGGESSVQSQLILGVDAWSLHPSVERDAEPNLAAGANTWLMLPNAKTEQNYRDVSPFLRYEADASWSQALSGELRFRADQNFGAVFDELALTWQPSAALGARVGVLDFKTTWCRTYDVDSPWMREPDSFCTFNQIKDGVAGAPGVQLVSQSRFNTHLVSLVAGFYDPMLLDYDTNEFSNFFTSPNMRVQENQKTGLSLSWLNTYTANEIRASWLRSKQVASDILLVAPVKQSSDLLYLAATQHWGARNQLRYVYTRFLSERAFSYLPFEDSPQFDVLSLPDQRDSHAVEWLYQWTGRDRLALGASLFEMRARETSASNGQISENIPFFRLKHQGVYVGWRREISQQMFVTAQAMWVSQRHAYFEAPSLNSHAQAFGLRWGYRY